MGLGGGPDAWSTLRQSELLTRRLDEDFADAHVRRPGEHIEDRARHVLGCRRCGVARIRSRRSEVGLDDGDATPRGPASHRSASSTAVTATMVATAPASPSWTRRPATGTMSMMSPIPWRISAGWRMAVVVGSTPHRPLQHAGAAAV